ncbi:MAG: winged helix-turn-helix domain-containing protein, partial [Candidatus Wallbacteria bacterium]|nr:winged helix-turn-helix domain-containing protein [Candidatus Wallbacteria bacterium]
RLERSVEQFMIRFGRLKNEPYVILTEKDGRMAGNDENLVRVREQSSAFGIFIDFCENRLLLNGRFVPLFKKTVLIGMMFELVRDPGKVVSAPALFRAVWGRSLESDSDGSNLRMNISRLRTLLGEKGTDLIRSSEEKSGYFFNNESDFCLIYRK